MFRKILTLTLSTLLVATSASFTAFASGLETNERTVARTVQLDRERLRENGPKAEFNGTEKFSMAEYENQKAKARRMSTGKKVAIGVGIAVGVIVVLAVAVKNTEIRTL